MRPLVFCAVVALSACAAVPRPACGCLPPAQPEMPLPAMSPADEAAIVVDALRFACLKEAEPTVFVRGAVQAGWLKQGTPEAGSTDCVVQVEGPPVRMEAVDQALHDWSQDRGLPWNIRDHNGRPVEGGTASSRVRGGTVEGQFRLAWNFVRRPEGDDRPTTMTIRITRPSA